MAEAGNHSRKVAFIIAMVSRAMPGVGDEVIAERIYHLVKNGYFEAFGDITKWRHSEVRRRDASTSSLIASHNT